MRLFIFLPLILTLGCSPQSQPQPAVIFDTDDTEIAAAAESALGAVERDGSGKIVGIDLAKERASATDDVLRTVLTSPNLKRFRLAGGNITAPVFTEMARQESLEELYLQDLPINDEELAAAIAPLSKLKRLTLRRLTKITALPELPSLRNLALIEMNVAESALKSIIERKELTALDLRNCSGLTPNDYRNITALDKLTDLKIGGFAVNDEVLEAIIPLSRLNGLTIDDAFITPDGFAKFVSDSPSSKTLEMLALNRDMSITDDALLGLKNLPRLKRLTVCGMMITGNFLTRLAEDETSRPKLEQLSLRKSLLTAEDAESLKKYSKLRVLNLSGVGMSQEIAEAVTQLNSLEELDLQDCLLDDDMTATFQKMKSLKKLRR